MEGNKNNNNYSVDAKITMEFTPQEYTEIENTFKAIDLNKDGVIEKSELKTVMNSMGYRDISDDELTKMVADVDLNNDKCVNFSEFLNMMRNFKKSGKETNFTRVVTRTGSVFRVGENQNNSFSTFSEEERSCFVRVINSVLAQDNDCKKFLPINPDSMDIFASLVNGIILCKLINVAQPGTIDERVINKKENMNVFLVAENLKLALTAAKSIGCQIINIFPDTIIEQKFVLILGLLWQIIKMVILKEINLKQYPQLIRLAKEGEAISDLLKLSPEGLLLRWFNYHLTAAGYETKITNFSGDVRDSIKYTILLNQLNSQLCEKSALNDNDYQLRAVKVLENAKKLGVEHFITSKDINSGNSKLNTIFTANIFNTCHGLDPPTEEETVETAKLLNDDAEGSREERAFRMWMNSLNLENVYVNHLYEDVKSGVILLKVIDKIKPGSVEWKKVDQTSTNKFKKIVNCNEAVDACKKAGLSIVGIGGTDLHDGNKKLTLGIVWQLMRSHTLQVLGNKTEDDLLKWANEMAKDKKATSFRDKTLTNSLFFIHLEAAIDPRVVDWELVMKDSDSAEAIENNAKYAISIARKLGASIFLVWEDIKEVKTKMLMTFVAGLYDVYLLEQKLKNEKNKIKKFENELKGDLNVGIENKVEK